jgi:DNA-directed RNA polymerase subunit beta
MKPDLEDMSDQDIQRIAAFYRNGVHMATPVFDGAKEEELKQPCSSKQGPEPTGQTTLYDGQYGRGV